MMKRPWNTNYSYKVKKIGPCKRCGFAGKINDWETAKRLGETHHVITCPDCKGAGEKVEWVSLENALVDLVERGLSLEPEEKCKGCGMPVPECYCDEHNPAREVEAMQRALACCQNGDYVMAAYILGEALQENK